MQAVDLSGDLNDYLFDEDRQIPKAHLNSVCLFKQGEKTCRYICLTPKGFVCVKKTPMKNTLDARVHDGDMEAKSDNCEGLGKEYAKKN